MTSSALAVGQYSQWLMEKYTDFVLQIGRVLSCISDKARLESLLLQESVDFSPREVYIKHLPKYARTQAELILKQKFGRSCEWRGAEMAVALHSRCCWSKTESKCYRCAGQKPWVALKAQLNDSKFKLKWNNDRDDFKIVAILNWSRSKLSGKFRPISST